ncbi:MAG: type II toxin-antitoxin system antitoxin SocA domain-containing protein, partial [Sulfurimonas sp.]
IIMNLKKLREKYGMSQTELSQRLDMSRPTLVKVEKGERHLTQGEEEKLQRIIEVIDNHQASSHNDVRINIPEKNIEKFKQVLLYVLEKTAGKPNVGMTVLYKLLYFIDFDYYEKYEEQLMGLTYIKNHYGPSPREFFKVVEEMKKNGELEEVKSSYFTHEQKKFLPHIKMDVSRLNAQEIMMVDSVLTRYADRSAKELSELSHEDTPWISAEIGENMEYEHVFYRPEKLSVRQYDVL